jgi:hypothetical protein
LKKYNSPEVDLFLDKKNFPVIPGASGGIRLVLKNVKTKNDCPAEKGGKRSRISSHFLNSAR